MVNLTVKQIKSLMNRIDNVRNISLIGQTGSGKSNTLDSLIVKSGIIIPDDECERCYGKEYLLNSVTTYLYYEYNNTKVFCKDPYFVNLINSTGHLDLSFEVVSSLRLTDGVIILIDYSEGVSMQIEMNLRQAMIEKTRPIAIINKLDRSILEFQQDGEDIYQNMLNITNRLNETICGFEQPGMDNLHFNPVKGTVAFSSAKEGWGFTVSKFASIYSQKFGVDAKKLVDMFWGDNYYNPETKKWVTQSTTQDGKILQRGFVQFIMEPIIKLSISIMDGKEDQLNEIMGMLELTLSFEEKELKGRNLLRAVLSKWINFADCLLEMTVLHLPSPKEGQKYRVAHLYEGPQDDKCAQGIRSCDPNGPLMIYISQMIPCTSTKSFYAIGRIFSGTVRAGQKVRIMGPNYKPGKEEDLAIKTIERAVLMMSKWSIEPIDDVPCGNVIALLGIDQTLLKTGTVSDYEEAYNIRAMKFSMSHVVRVTVEPKDPADLPKLIENLGRLAKCDPCVVINQENNASHVLVGDGELHIEACLKYLQTYELCKCEINHSELSVSYRETVTQTSRVCMAKSANKHNRLYCTAQPLSEDLGALIEKGGIGAKNDLKQKAKILTEDFGWDKEEKRNAVVIEEEPISETPLTQIKSYLPVVNSFGLSSDLMLLTSGKALVGGLYFNHWSALDGDPLDPQTKSFEIMVSIRKRKGIKQATPSLNDYLADL